MQLDMEFCTSDSVALASNRTDPSSLQQSWMPSQSASHQSMLTVALAKLLAMLPMLVEHWVCSSAEQPMWSMRLAE